MATPEDHGKSAAAAGDASTKAKSEDQPATFFDPADHSTTIPKDVLDALEDPSCGRLQKGVRFADVPGSSAAVGEAEVLGCGGTTDEVLGKPADPAPDTSSGAASSAASGAASGAAAGADADAGTTSGADPSAGQPAADQGKAAKPAFRAKSIGEQLHELKAKMSPKK